MAWRFGPVWVALAVSVPPETIEALIEALADARTGARPGEAEPRRRAGRTGRGGLHERR